MGLGKDEAEDSVRSKSIMGLNLGVAENLIPAARPERGRDYPLNRVFVSRYLPQDGYG